MDKNYQRLSVYTVFLYHVLEVAERHLNCSVSFYNACD